MRIGDQVPFSPPLGVPYIAWQGAKAVKRWISRAGETAEARTHAIDVLAATRRQELLRRRGRP